MEIFEFSTGINVKGDRSKWVSTGFTGIMNSTFSGEIPEAINEAIASLRLSGTAETNSYAMIGREVEKNGEEWSILTTISNFEDDKGRTGTGYRYFAVKGKGHLGELVEWHKQQNEPKFDPFDFNAQPSKLTNISVPDQFNNKVISDSIIDYQKITAQEINNLAQQKAGNDLVSWAWNVHGLENPGSFNVVSASSEKSTRILREARDKYVLDSQVGARGQKIDNLRQAIRTFIHNPLNDTRIEKLKTAYKEAQKYLDPDKLKKIYDSLGYNYLDSYSQHDNNNIRLLLLSSLLSPELKNNNLNILRKASNSKDILQKSQEVLRALNSDNNINVKSFNDLDILLSKQNQLGNSKMVNQQEYWQDTDNDGVPDGIEKQQYSDPFRRDSDNDGIPDREEITNNTNPRGKNKESDAENAVLSPEQLRKDYFETVKKCMGWEHLHEVSYNDLCKIVGGNGIIGTTLDKLVTERSILDGDSKNIIYCKLTQSAIGQYLKNTGKLDSQEMEKYIKGIYNDRVSYLQEKYHVAQHVQGNEKKEIRENELEL
jgi:hypothetical protein